MATKKMRCVSMALDMRRLPSTWYPYVTKRSTNVIKTFAELLLKVNRSGEYFKLLQFYWHFGFSLCNWIVIFLSACNLERNMISKTTTKKKRRKKRIIHIFEVSSFLWKQVLYIFNKKSQDKRVDLLIWLSYGTFIIPENSCDEKLEIINLSSSVWVLLQCLKIWFDIVAYSL